MAFDAEFNLSDLDGGNGFVINGIDPDDGAGYSVSNAGDINNDGIDDVIIGTFAASTNDSAENPNSRNFAGQSYVIFGSASGFDSSLELSDLDGSNGFAINGSSSSDHLGRSVSGAGDVNGDGINDLIIGAPGASPDLTLRNAGQSYVVFGSASSFSSSLNLSDLDGSNGFAINGSEFLGMTGSSVSGAGDINNDGIDDLIVSGGNLSDDLYVVFGSASSFNSSLNLSDLDGSNGFAISSDPGQRGVGDVSGIGDINGDGIDDIIVGFPSDKVNLSEFSAGRSYVIFGNEDGFDSSLVLSDIDGDNGFVINGIDRRDISGFSVSGAGDINGDSINDLIIGAPGASPNNEGFSGQSYVIFGNASGFDNFLELSELNGSNGFAISGVDSSDASGDSVSGAGDINGDGFDDLIIGASDSGAGDLLSDSVYVVYGSGSFGSSLELSNLDGSNGFEILSIGVRDLADDVSVSGAGDINGDGIDDLIIGAPSADPDGNLTGEQGQIYVVFGQPSDNDEIYRYDGSMYLLSQPGTWEEAQAKAESLGGNLATINDAAEQAWLNATFGDDDILWIGYTDRAEEGNWQWVDGSDVTYENWAPGEPNNFISDQILFGEDYGVMDSFKGGWNDLSNLDPFLWDLQGIIEIPLPTDIAVLI